MKKWLPIILTGVMAAWFFSTLRAPQDKTFAFTEFGKLPVLASGRVQPIDSLARNSLLQIREKQEANLEPWKGAFGKQARDPRRDLSSPLPWFQRISGGLPIAY